MGRKEAGPSIVHSGQHAVNKLLTVLLLRAPMCRVSAGRRFAKTRPCSKTQTMPYYIMFNRHVCDVTSCVSAWSIFSAYIVIQCL